MANTRQPPSVSQVAPDGMYASVPSGGSYARPGELADEPAMERLRVLCATWGTTPHLTDELTDYTARQPSTLGTGGN